jgi:hypothetical protein
VTGDLEVLIDRALALNPNLTTAWYASGWVRAFLGKTDLAIDHVARAMRLSPLDPLMFLMQAATGVSLNSRPAKSSFAALAAGYGPLPK